MEKRCLAACLAACLLSGPVFGKAEKISAPPELFQVSVEAEERKEDDNRYFICKERLVTANGDVNAQLAEIADGFERELRPAMKPDKDRNARRNSRLDIENIFYFTGDSWLSVMTLARVSYQREQVCSPFTTRTYDLRTGQRVMLTDLFKEDSAAWELLESRVREHVNGLFPYEERNASAVEALCARERLEQADFTLSGMELTLHYEAREVYADKPCLMHVRFYYDELWDLMTDAARRQTDNRDWKMVALTCDDGPGYKESGKALTGFRRAGARVTYFTVGKRAAGNPDVLLRQFDENHLIASHSYDHWSGYSMKKAATRRLQIDQHNELLLKLTGEPVTMFRAPGGTYPPWVEADINLPVIQWSVDTYDYTGKDAKHIFYSIRNNVQDGDIILMHDTGAELWKAIPLFAGYLTRNGYMMVTVDELAHRNGVTMRPNEVYYRFFEGETGKRKDSNL